MTVQVYDPKEVCQKNPYNIQPGERVVVVNRNDFYDGCEGLFIDFKETYSNPEDPSYETVTYCSVLMYYHSIPYQNYCKVAFNPESRGLEFEEWQFSLDKLRPIGRDK